MYKRYLNSCGKRHARLGISPLQNSKHYLDGYNKQYALEQSYFNFAPF